MYLSSSLDLIFDGYDTMRLLMSQTTTMTTDNEKKDETAPTMMRRK